MQIYIQPSYEGGAGNFLNRLAARLVEVGEAITRDVNADWDVGLINVVLSPSEQRAVMRRRRPIILRFDGAPLKASMLDSIQLHVRALTSYLQCAGVIYQSHSSRHDWRVRLPHGRPETIIHNGIQPDPALHWHPRPGLSRDGISFAAMVILRYWHQVDFMVEFLDAEARLGRNHRLTIYGPVLEDARPRLEAHERITLAGPIEAEEVRNKLLEHDCFVFLNRHAPCPNAVIEAMSTGIPVLLPDVGAIRELVGVEHPIFRIDDGERAAVMTQVVDRVVGEALSGSSRWGEDNLARVEEHFNIQKVADRYLDFLTSRALDGPGRT